MKIISVVGARPNFMKVAPIHKAVNEKRKTSKVKIEHLICHTGQHYDDKMSKIFFDELELPKPNFYLGVGGGSHAEQTGKVMIEFEKVLLQEKPDLVLVVGDVNSTIACSLTAVKLGIKVAHVEAGLRSFDRAMPEEINRILTDSISDYLFVSEPAGMRNLRNEGANDKKIIYVGNTMIDNLITYLPAIEKSNIFTKLTVRKDDYVLVTFHRPSNVDKENNLESLVKLLNRLSVYKKVVFPVHPRTRVRLKESSLEKSINGNIILTEPIGYIDFTALVKSSALVITDSGGIQEETTFLGVQCITTRKTTERPITVDIGTNTLVGEDFDKAFSVSCDILDGKRKTGQIPELWDGKTAERICDYLTKETTSF